MIFEGKIIITTIKTQDSLELFYTADQIPPNGACKCDEFTLNSCVISAVNQTGGGVQYKFKINYQKSTAVGICTLRDFGNNPIDTLAFVGTFFFFFFFYI